MSLHLFDLAVVAYCVLRHCESASQNEAAKEAAERVLSGASEDVAQEVRESLQTDDVLQHLSTPLPAGVVATDDALVLASAKSREIEDPGTAEHLSRSLTRRRARRKAVVAVCAQMDNRRSEDFSTARKVWAAVIQIIGEHEKAVSTLAIQQIVAWKFPAEWHTLIPGRDKSLDIVDDLHTKGGADECMATLQERGYLPWLSRQAHSLGYVPQGILAELSSAARKAPTDVIQASHGPAKTGGKRTKPGRQSIDTRKLLLKGALRECHFPDGDDGPQIREPATTDDLMARLKWSKSKLSKAMNSLFPPVDAGAKGRERYEAACRADRLRALLRP